MKSNKVKTSNETRKLISKVLLSTLAIVGITLLVMISYAVFYVASMANEKVPYDVGAAKLRLTSVVYVNGEDGQPKEYDRAYNIENREWVDYQDIPQQMKDAIISIEDRRFWNHKGVDWTRTAGAVLNLLIGKGSYGGSTLTQQLIKNLTEDNEVSINRKIKEIFRALNFEKEHSKDEVLEAYLNVVNFGNGCRGVQAAAKLYFNKEIKDCSIAECAAIAGITQNPAKYNPLVYPENNKIRRNLVINEMKSQERISQEEYDKAMDESERMEFKVAETDDEDSSSIPVRDWYTEAVFNDVINDLCEKFSIGRAAASEMLYTQGFKIYSAMDTKAQNIAESVISDPNLTPKDEKLEIGYLMMDYDGRVLASIGSRKKKTGNLWFDRANGAKRQPGSAIKPIGVYAPAINYGLYNYSSVLPDVPVDNFFGEGKPGPSNWYKSYRGAMLLKDALEISANAPAVHVLQKMTTKKSYDFLTSKLHFKNISKNDIYSLGAFSLGGLENGVTVKEMTSAFQIFGNGGVYHNPYTYFYVLDRNGKILLDNRDKIGDQAITPRTSTIMNRLLKNVISNGTGKAAAINGWEVIGKTGTTNDKKDSWLIAGTPYAMAGIWLGYDSPKEIKETRYTQSIWKKIMEDYLKGKEVRPFELDESVVERPYCNQTGMLSGACPSSSIGYYSSDNMPPVCTTHGGVPVENIPEDTQNEAAESEEINPEEQASQ